MAEDRFDADINHIYRKAHICALQHQSIIPSSQRRGFCDRCLADLRDNVRTRDALHPPYKESQESIDAWVRETFKDGPNANNNRPARLREEMAELLLALQAIDAADSLETTVDAHTAADEEAADVYLTLVALCAEVLKCNLHARVDEKMARNRASEWVPNASGRIVRKGKEDRPESAIPTVIVARNTDDMFVTQAEVRALFRQLHRHHISHESESGRILNRLLNRLKRALPPDVYARYLEGA